MELINISNTMAEQWNDFVGQWPDFSLMQSYEWGTFKEALGWKVVRLAVEQQGKLVAGAQMLIKSLPLGLASIAYIPRGPLLNWEDEPVAQTLLSALHTSARQHRAVSLKIEPAVRYSPEMQQQLEAYGFQNTPFTNQPQCSMLIDLTPDADTILATMNKTTRYNIHYSARKGVVIREAATETDFDGFYHLIESTAQRVGFSVRSKEYYRVEWKTLQALGRLKFFLAYYEGELLAARMPAVFNGKAATFHSASSDIHMNLKPNELLMWESIKWAKAQGCAVYDVWGIPNEIGEHQYKNKPLPQEQKGGLWGVYNFKRGFGGDLVYYVGTYDYVYSKLWYGLINLTMSRLGSLDKLARLGD